MMSFGPCQVIIPTWGLIVGVMLSSAQAQTRFPPLTNQPRGVQPDPGQSGMPQGGYPGQSDPGQGRMPQGGYPGQSYPGQGGMPVPRSDAGGDPQLEARLDTMMAEERRDMGVRPTAILHNNPMHGPTPNQIPGGQVITTKGLYGLVRGAGVPFVVFDVLGSDETLPGALSAVPAAQPGSFQDQNQQQFGQFLAQVTRGNRDTALVFYCQGIQCWMSYNAALRAINLGYRNVLWYRGGLEAWKYAGLPTQPVIGRGGPSMKPGQPAPYPR
jgi:PQQ-dependent catabolism-associated CXXCW motif protein